MIRVIQKMLVLVLFLQFLISITIPAVSSDNFSLNILGNGENDCLLSSNELIQSMIDTANPYDIIYVPNGTYDEHLFISKPITLIGQPQTIIDGSYEKTLLTIHSDDVILQNISFQHSGGNTFDSGIWVQGENVTILNCTFTYLKQGVFFQQVKNAIIDSCQFHSTGKAIVVHESDQMSITNCSIQNSALGLHFLNSTSLSLSHSLMKTNGISMFTRNSSHIMISESIVIDNSDNHGGLFFFDSDSVEIHHTSVNHNGIGINIDDSDQVIINQCHITNNTHFGILLREQAEQITIMNCLIDNNKRYGIYGYEKTSVIIHRNSIFDNLLYGLYTSKPVYVLDQNWWGSAKGPSLSSVGISDRITINNYLFHFRQWRTQPYSMHYRFSDYSDELLNPVMFHQNISKYLLGNDSDGDIIPDWWEEKYGYNVSSPENHQLLDEDQDGLNNIKECYTDLWGSNPYQKDVFLEIDWIASQKTWTTNTPSESLLQQLQETFSLHNITLHIDTGNMGGGGLIPDCSTDDFSDMIDVYWDHFLENDIQHPRKGIFHYAIIADECADVSYPFFGWNSLDGIAISAEKAKHLSPQYHRQMIIAGGILHQLGSTMGLLVETHQGNDNWLASTPGTIEWVKYHQYKSSMNYLYKYRILSFSDGNAGRYDFNDWDHLNFSFFQNSCFPLNDQEIDYPMIINK